VFCSRANYRSISPVSARKVWALSICSWHTRRDVETLAFHFWKRRNAVGVLRKAAEDTQMNLKHAIAVKKTWEKVNTANARRKRHPVVVNGRRWFRSVPQAFRELGLPMSKHQKFRRDLVASEHGRLRFDWDDKTFNFRLAEKMDDTRLADLKRVEVRLLH
jgi:hypothetical protein